MLYTKQQLKDAYYTAVAGDNDPSTTPENAWFAAEIVRVQNDINAQLLVLTRQKTHLINKYTNRIDAVQAQIDAIEPVAKESMKDVALNYIWEQDNAQDEIDTSGVSL